MTPHFLLVLAAVTGFSACEPRASEPVEYRPAEAGTVDHALCLLGFVGLPLLETPTGHHLIEARLNGRPATFVVDTGANLSVLHAPYASEFAIGAGSPVRGMATGIGGTLQARRAPIDSLVLGEVPVRLRRIAVADLGQLAAVLGPISGRTIHGIIGQDVLAEHRAVIDVAGPLLHLIAADRDPAPVAAGECGRETEGEAEAN